jgi:hypothetical protein
MSKRSNIPTGPSMYQLETWTYAAKAYAEGRVDTDPTIEIPEQYRSGIRAEAEAHVARLEQNRVSRANAQRYRASRSSDGEVIIGSPSGVEEVYVPPRVVWRDD